MIRDVCREFSWSRDPCFDSWLSRDLFTKQLTWPWKSQGFCLTFMTWKKKITKEKHDESYLSNVMIWEFSEHFRIGRPCWKPNSVKDYVSCLNFKFELWSSMIIPEDLLNKWAKKLAIYSWEYLGASCLWSKFACPPKLLLNIFDHEGKWSNFPSLLKVQGQRV